MTPEAFGVRIMERRQKNGWTQTGLGQRIGLTKQSISRLENGTQNIALSEILALARVFETTVAELFYVPEDAEGELRPLTARERRMHLMIDSLLELSENDQKEVAFVLALVLEGKLDANHKELFALLRDGMTVR